MQGWTRSPYMLAPPAHTSDITRRDGRVLWVVVRSDISSWAYGAADGTQVDAWSSTVSSRILLRARIQKKRHHAPVVTSRRSID